MTISKDTEEILQFLDYTTNDNLRKRNDLGIILELSATYGEVDVLNDIIFSATSLWKIHKTIQRAGEVNEGIEKLKTESVNQADFLKSKLNTLIGDENPDISERFDEVYFQKTAGAFYNLIDIAHDLAELKKIQLDKKNKNSSVS
ncbi:MAG: hypothetical protein DRI94_14850 [Bacteroidetes bacterium]|nr:MAG: hypothetical protein DRI94_14850 [Bacteroidota bacterium]